MNMVWSVCAHHCCVVAFYLEKHCVHSFVSEHKEGSMLDSWKSSLFQRNLFFPKRFIFLYLHSVFVCFACFLPVLIFSLCWMWGCTPDQCVNASQQRALPIWAHTVSAAETSGGFTRNPTPCMFSCLAVLS